MSKFTEDIQILREATGAGVMECKRALTEAEGDFEKAKKIIYESGLAKFEKRAGRETGAGLIETYVHNGRIGVMLEVRAETDFVVRSEPFQKLSKELVMQIAAMNPENVDALLDQPYVKDESRNVDSLVKETSAKVGENIRVAQFFRIEV